MNERIKELAEQALIHANKTWDPESDPNIFVKIAMEKHAELIVRECMTLCEDVTERNDPAIACYYEIKKHFGVDGMSTEDKKTLIKELLGVNNEPTNQTTL